MERDDDDAPSVHKEKGAKSSSLFFSCLLKPFFKGVSIYILLPASVLSNSVYYVLQVSHLGVFTSFDTSHARARKNAGKDNQHHHHHQTLFSFSLCSNHRPRVCSIFNVCKKKRRYYFPPVSTVCSWLAVQEGVPPHPSPPLLPKPVHSDIHRGLYRGGSGGATPQSVFLPPFLLLLMFFYFVHTTQSSDTHKLLVT